MKILEFEAKQLLSAMGLPVPQGMVISTPAAAEEAAQRIACPLVLKAQIPMGGRMKAGGIRFADTASSAVLAARELLGATLHGFQVEHLLVEEKLPITREIFVAVTYDATLRSPTILATMAGGIDVEKTNHFVQRSFSLLMPVPGYIGRDIAAELGFHGSQLLSLGKIVTLLIQCFVQWDALLLELNPVIMDSTGKWWVADVHLELDDEAAYRQEPLRRQAPISRQIASQRSVFEEQAAAIDGADHRGVAGRVIPFGGSIGLLIGGGGASLTIMDLLLEAGLAPANYCEIGGNPSVWKIKELTKLILRQPQVKHLAVMMNVVSNTRSDLVARGVVKGVLELDRKPHEVIVAFRIPGSWEEEGRSIMKHYGIPFFGRETSIDQVVEAIKWRF